MQPSQGSSGGDGINPISLQAMQQRLQQLQGQQQYKMQSTSHLQPQGGGLQPSGQPQQQSQTQQLQHQSQLSADFSGMSSQQLAALQGSTAAARMMMQQQHQQQQQPSSASNLGQINMAPGGNAASVLGNWGSLQHMGGNVGSTLEASSGSSARLLAMSGIGVHGSRGATSAAAQNIQALLQQKASQAQFSSQGALAGNFQASLSNSGVGGAGAFAGHDASSLSAAAAQMTPQQQLLFQQQFANLQKQMQQQQQQQQVGVGGVISSNSAAAMVALRNAGGHSQGAAAMQAATAQHQNPQFARQQQLLQQLQQQQQQQQQQQRSNSAQGVRMSPPTLQPQQSSHSNDSSTMMGLNQQQLSLLQQQQSQGMTSSSSVDVGGLIGRGSINEAQLRLQQQNFLRASSTGQQAMGNDALENARRMFAQAQQQASSLPGASSGASASQGLNSSNPNSVGHRQLQQGSHHGVSGMMEASMHQFARGNSSSILQSGTSQSAVDSASMQHDQQSFLDGNFAGGWQSNADLPDRRRIIFHILDVIKVMRPENSKMSNKLPHMAKSLEEHLYRSAHTKEQYLDMSTLKQRLQAIAHGLEVHRSSSGGAVASVSQASQGAHQSLQQQTQPGLSSVAGLSNSSWSLQQKPAPNAMQLSMGMQSSYPSGLDNSQSSGSDPLSAGGMMGNGGSHSHSPAEFLQRSALQDPTAQQDTPWTGNQNSGIEELQASQFNLGSLGSITAQQAAAAAMSQGGIGGLTNVAAMQMMGNSVGMSSFPPTSQSQMNQQYLPSGSALSQPSPQIGKEARYKADELVKLQDPAAAQKKKVILQQQQRLLLLRHASKCTVGPSCPTKFCAQMVTLWRHMKTCRDKNCRTSHCLSSRCVLNHYRICKSNGKTSTCEVCGPVMAKIKQVEREDTSSDPLTREQEQANATQVPPQSSSMAQKDVHALAVTEQSHFQLLQSQKIQARIENLQQLQRQQNQLLEQQRRLQEQARSITDPSSQQAQQLQQQQILLTQLQNRCRQQQILLQKELHEQTGGQVPMLQAHEIQAHQQQQQQQLLQLHALQATHHLHNAQGNQDTGSMLQLQALQSVETPTTDSLGPMVSLPDITSAEPAKKRRSRSDGKPTPVGRDGKGRRGSGIGKTMTMSQLAAVTDVQPKKRQGASTPKERSQKKPKKSVSDATSIPDQFISGSADSSSVSESTLVSSMTKEEISRHIESLNKRIWLSSRMVTHKCLPIVQDLIDDPFGWVFIDAVDPVALGLPDYFEVVKNPMHLELVKKKLENAIYAEMETFERDAKLVFENAILYNGEESEVGQLAQSMLVKFEQLYKDVVQGIESSHQRLESRGEVCSLCGSQKRLFEPAVLYCQGKCGMQRIKRQATYFTDRTKQNHWCDACYEQLNPHETIVLDDGNEVMKKDLQEFKNDAVPEEGWVNCDVCKTWVHQICALFNGRTNKSSATFTCPNCYVHQCSPGQPSLNTMKGASELPETKLSRAIEKGLGEALANQYVCRAKELSCGIDEVEKADGLTVRVVSNVDKRHYVGDEMAEYYREKGCPTGFPVRTKCIALFQKIHGVDTLLFALYVYEYGHHCPAPNRRRVYISYLDSVQYFEPKCYRTAVYHSILIEYLRYVKARGFHTAHLWSCPPTPGDDYVFYCHPKHQKVPREDMLRGWYHSMLDKAKALGIVIRTTTLYDEYFKPDAVDVAPLQRNDATCLPYFEGDYIPGEIENIIRQLKVHPNPTSDGKGEEHDDVMARLGHNLRKMQDNFIVVHLRNRRFASAVERGDDVSNWREDSDEELIRSKRAKISGKDTSLSADPVVSNLKSEQSVPSPPNVVVAATSASDKIEDGSVMSEPDDGKPHPITSSLATTQACPPEVVVPDTMQPELACDVASASSSCQPLHARADENPTHNVDGEHPNDEEHEPAKGERTDEAREEEPADQPTNASLMKSPADDDPATVDVPVSHALTAIDGPHSEALEPDSSEVIPELHRIVESEKSQVDMSTRDIESKLDVEDTQMKSLDEMKKMVASHVASCNLADMTVSDTADEDEPFESDLFESRQMFLNYCQTTHCQFDELRRAKHSSMMVLFQLHNPSAPKFLQQCGSCYLDITHGIRYHCNTCPDFDLCQDCYEPVTSGLWAKRDARFAHDKSHSFTPVDMEIAPGSPPSHEDRQKALKAHIDLLEHAGRCPGPPSCALQNCVRMKGLFEHVRSCDVRPKKDCRICCRLLSLCAMHARMCSVRSGACPIPFCDRIRERHMRLRRQQQQMDDRRRQAQNELYHAGDS